MRLARADRREQILRAAAETFVAHGGFAATSMAEVAQQAGITRIVLYRHFDSKAALYQATIDRAAAKLHEAATVDGSLHEHSVAGIVRWASAEPAEFRLLFHQAAREPAFAENIQRMRDAMAETLRPHLPTPDGPWALWAARLASSTTIEAIMCWLDVGRPNPDELVERILQSIDGVFAAARPRDNQARDNQTHERSPTKANRHE